MKESNSSDIILYNSPEGNIRVEVMYSGETFWRTQKRMAELHGVEVPAISKHLKNIFETGELQEDAVISKMETTAADGKNYVTAFYDLDAILLSAIALTASRPHNSVSGLSGRSGSLLSKALCWTMNARNKANALAGIILMNS